MKQKPSKLVGRYHPGFGGWHNRMRDFLYWHIRAVRWQVRGGAITQQQVGIKARTDGSVFRCRLSAWLVSVGALKGKAVGAQLLEE